MEYKFTDGTNKGVLLSAPHAVNVTSERGLHMCDLYTWELAYSLGIALNIHTIIMQKDIGYDANYTLDCNYRAELKKYIQSNNTYLILDFHKSKSDRPYDISIGTNYGENLNKREYILNLFIEELSCYNIKIDNTFNAGSRTVTYIKLYDKLYNFIKKVIWKK